MNRAVQSKDARIIYSVIIGTWESCAASRKSREITGTPEKSGELAGTRGNSRELAFFLEKF